MSYKISCSVTLALRYIPDIQREYHDIAQSQQARGIGMGKKASLVRRLNAASSILVPLILSGMDRIEVISNAMKLRWFGKKKSARGTWRCAPHFWWARSRVSPLWAAGFIIRSAERNRAAEINIPVYQNLGVNGYADWFSFIPV